MKCDKLSASKIKTNKMCEFKYYLTYHLGIDLGTSFAAEQGSMVHVIFEKFGEAKRDGIKNPDIETKWYEYILYAYQKEGIWLLSDKALYREKACEGCQFHGIDNVCQLTNTDVSLFAGCPKDEFLDSIKLVEKIINDPGPNNPLNKEIIDVEQKFDLIIEDGNEKIPVNGIIDVVTKHSFDSIEIIDYKTGKHMMSYNECLKDPQLLIYNLAVNSQYKDYKNFFITINYLRANPITLCYEKEDLTKTTNSLIKNWYLIKGNQTPKRRCDRNDGTVVFDHICKYMCKPEICETHYKEFIDNGGIILPESQGERKKKTWIFE